MVSTFAAMEGGVSIEAAVRQIYTLCSIFHHGKWTKKIYNWHDYNHLFTDLSIFKDIHFRGKHISMVRKNWIKNVFRDIEVTHFTILC